MAEKPKLSLIIDAMELKIDGMQEIDGILSVPAVVAKHMIQDYDGLKVLKPAEELEAAAQFADGIPITRGHPDAGIVTDRAEVLGFMKNPLFEDSELKATLEIADKDLAADVKDGKLTGLSIGFFCNLDRSEGTVGDEKYNAVQKDIFMNHVAVVDQGRCSIEDGCGFKTDAIDSPPDLIGKLDTAIGMATNEWGDNKLKDLLVEIKEMITAAGTTGDSDVVAGLTAKLDAMTADRDSLKDSIETIIKTEKDALIAQITAMQDAKTKEDLEKLHLDELKKELAMVKELQTDRLSFKGAQSGKSAVDDAYAKVGR
ncbi:MAG: DUF2213 domain-containing protein [ANME-2 cluster archaeon]|jgi:hypothetical protein|nr:MAG: DUF2213 domain-containing protein [ANME-2 cluster archaeon]